jgi:hypothetical protein
MTENTFFLQLVQVTLNIRHSLKLTKDVTIPTNSSIKKIFDLGDTSNKTFVEIFYNLTAEKRDIFSERISQLASVIVNSTIKTNQPIDVKIISEEVLTDTERNFYSNQFKQNNRIRYEFLDIKDILNFAEAFKKDLPENLQNSIREFEKKLNTNKNTMFGLIDSEKTDRKIVSIPVTDEQTEDSEKSINVLKLLFYKNPVSKKESKFWWLTASPKFFDYEKVEIGSVYKYPSKDINNQFKANFKKISVGEYIVTYDTKNKREAYALGLVVKITDIETYVKIIHLFDRTLSREEIQNHIYLSKTSVGKKASAPLLSLTIEAFLEIISYCIIDIDSLITTIDSNVLTAYRETRILQFEINPEPIEIEDSKNKNDQTKFRSDVAVEVDELGRQSVAKEFVNLIKNDVFQIKDNHSFIVHLQGEWGAGKSSFLKFIAKELTSNQKDDHWTIIEYNAWQNQHISPPWWTLLNNIYRKSKLQSSSRCNKVKLWFNENFRRIAWYSSWKNIFALLLTILFIILVINNFSSLSSLLLTNSQPNPLELITKLFIGIGSSIGLIHSLSKLVSSSILIRSSEDAMSFVKKSIDPMSNIKDHYQKLVDNIKGKNGNIAIFIDDIDRCNDVYVVELLEGIQTLFKERKVLYIIAGDRKWISKCFQNVYNNFDSASNKADSIGELFLQKTFQLSIRIPSISPIYREKYWHKMIGLNENQTENITLNELDSEQKNKLENEIDNAGDKILDNKFMYELETKYNLSGDTVNNLIIEKVKENHNEFEHALKDYHSILDINPRSILRLSNNYNISRAILISERKKYDPEKLVRWILIEELFPFVSDCLQEYENIEDFKSDFKEKVKSKMEVKRLLELMDGNEIIKGGKMTLEDIKALKGI